MSWAETKKINNNMKRTINEQLRDIKYNPIQVITSSTTYTPTKSGLYKVICVGSGGRGALSMDNKGYAQYVCAGCGGGVAIKTMRLDSSTSYNVTVSETASFGNILTATKGTTGEYNRTFDQYTAGTPGTATGGDYNYSGTKGEEPSVSATNGVAKSSTVAAGGSVGVVITDLYSRDITYSSEVNNLAYYGAGILGYGAGAPSSSSTTSPGYGKTMFSAKPAAVLIIPIEMEE